MQRTQHLGLSFAELTSAATQQQKAFKLDPSQLQPAGVATGAGKPQRGQGGLATVSSWSQGDASSCKLQASSEAHSQFRPPPAGTIRQSVVKPPASQLSKPDYPSVLRSVTQTDFQPDVLQRAWPPCTGSKMKDSGSPLPASTDKTEFATQTQSTFKAHTQDEWRAANSRPAGHPATHAVNYNIIHGGPAAANPNDAYLNGHDYRKTKPAN